MHKPNCPVVLFNGLFDVSHYGSDLQQVLMKGDKELCRLTDRVILGKL